MITDAILSIVFGLVDLLLTPLTVLNFEFDISKIEPVLQYFKMALYIIPFGDLLPIVTFFIALMSFRIAISLLKTLWDILPLV